MEARRTNLAATPLTTDLAAGSSASCTALTTTLTTAATATTYSTLAAAPLVRDGANANRRILQSWLLCRG